MMIDNLESILGYFDQDGQRKMPLSDIEGHHYTYPGNWVHLDTNTFVVVPVNFSNWPLIEALKAQIGAPKALKAKPKAADKPVTGEGDSGE